MGGPLERSLRGSLGQVPQKRSFGKIPLLSKSKPFCPGAWVAPCVSFFCQVPGKRPVYLSFVQIQTLLPRCLGSSLCIFLLPRCLGSSLCNFLLPRCLGSPLCIFLLPRCLGSSLSIFSRSSHLLGLHPWVPSGPVVSLQQPGLQGDNLAAAARASGQ